MQQQRPATFVDFQPICREGIFPSQLPQSQVTPGRLAYFLFYRPLGAWKRMINEGGPLEQWKTERGRREMEAAAWQLAASGGLKDEKTKSRSEAETARGGAESKRKENREKGAGDSGQEADGGRETGGKPIEVHVLTGRKFWYQTAFCLWSLAKASGREVVPHIYDDGSMRPEHAAYFREIFPSARVVEQEQIIGRLDRFLPESKFPRLRERWLYYPNIRKLTDPHMGAPGWKLVIDSDLLFFRSPHSLCQWADGPDRPLHAVDSETAYGYPLDVMSRLAGRQVIERLNVGLCGLQSEAIDWERLEYWCEELISVYGTHYYLEQALVAMLVAGRDCAVLPPSDYITLPVPPESSDCRAVMHHYVAGSKPWYFRRNWQHALELLS